MGPKRGRKGCIDHIQQLLTDAINSATLKDAGNINWMASMVVADMEEFFDNPFGSVDCFSVFVGSGSKNGFDMVSSKKEGAKTAFSDVLDEIVSHVRTGVTDPNYLTCMGYAFTNSDVVNMVNGRPFNVVDAEHFLCKAWIMAKYTMCPYRNYKKHPNQCNAFTHPSRTLHQLKDQLTDAIMAEIKNAFAKIANKEDCVLPGFCLLPGEK
jgi:hypothetical protein